MAHIPAIPTPHPASPGTQRLPDHRSSATVAPLSLGLTSLEPTKPMYLTATYPCEHALLHGRIWIPLHPAPCATHTYKHSLPLQALVCDASLQKTCQNRSSGAPTVLPVVCQTVLCLKCTHHTSTVAFIMHCLLAFFAGEPPIQQQWSRQPALSKEQRRFGPHGQHQLPHQRTCPILPFLRLPVCRPPPHRHLRSLPTTAVPKGERVALRHRRGGTSDAQPRRALMHTLHNQPELRLRP